MENFSWVYFERISSILSLAVALWVLYNELRILYKIRINTNGILSKLIGEWTYEGKTAGEKKEMIIGECSINPDNKIFTTSRITGKIPLKISGQRHCKIKNLTKCANCEKYKREGRFGERETCKEYAPDKRCSLENCEHVTQAWSSDCVISENNKLEFAYKFYTIGKGEVRGFCSLMLNPNKSHPELNGSLTTLPPEGGPAEIIFKKKVTKKEKESSEDSIC